MNTMIVPLLMALFFSTSICMREQSVAIKGILFCGDLPAAGVRVKMWEEDTVPDPDDMMAENFTNSKGEFHLSGKTSELTPIDPVLKIYHDCNDKFWPGLRRVKFGIPDKYITSGAKPNITMNIGTINLELEFTAEKRMYTRINICKK